MTTAQTIGISALSLIVLSLVFWGGSQLTDKNAYYCSATNMVMVCDKLSSTFITCYDTAGAGKRCTSLWTEIVNDVPIDLNNAPSGLKYRCWSHGCEPY